MSEPENKDKTLRAAASLKRSLKKEHINVLILELRTVCECLSLNGFQGFTRNRANDIETHVYNLIEFGIFRIFKRTHYYFLSVPKKSLRFPVFILFLKFLNVEINSPTEIWTHSAGAIVCLSAAADCRRTGA